MSVQQHGSTGPKLKWANRLLMLLAITLAFGIADVLARLAMQNLDAATWGPALRRFLTSPGAAGVAAVVAATIGAVGLHIQLAHTKSKDRSQAWWTKFEWATERAVPSTAGDTAVPTSLSINTLNSLQESATDDLQRRGCGGFVDHLVTLTRSERTKIRDMQRPNADFLSIETESDSKFNALKSYVQSTAGTQASSLAAEYLVQEWEYEAQVLTAIGELHNGKSIIRVDSDRLLPRGTRAGDYAAVCEFEGQEVVVAIVGGSLPKLVETIKGKAARIIRSYTELDLPLLIISPLELQLDKGVDQGKDVHCFTWTIESGAELVAASIREVCKGVQNG
jgi:hypothetical protein